MILLKSFIKIANFDLSLAPIVVIRITEDEPNEELFDNFLIEIYETVFNASGRIVLLTDLTHGRFLAGVLRTKMADWLRG